MISQGPHRLALTVALGTVLLLLPGCAARFQLGALPRAELSGGGKAPPGVASFRMQAPESGIFREVMLDSGHFSALIPEHELGDRKPGLHLDVRLRHSGNTRNATRTLLHQLACGITLTAIPYWGTDSTQLVVHVSRPDGTVEDYLIEDRLTLVAWLPMVAVQLPRMALEPFFGTVEDRFHRNLFRTLVQRMAEDGVFGAVPTNTSS